MHEDPLQVFLPDRVEDAPAAALFDDPHGCFRRVLERDRQAASLRDLREVLAGKRRIELAARDCNVLGIAAAALIAKDSDALRFDLRARGRVLQSFQRRLATAFLCPGGQQGGADAGGRRGVRILIDVASTPRARASSTMRRVSTERPQLALPTTLWWVICVGKWPRSPITSVSRTLSITPLASSRICEM